ncbi:proton-conducting transporter membrane subunit [Streptomyces sp. WMMC500]|uniref:proton-conducting transporter transmembrane domain-containing protein n=1 Tax=Streptomyces sp. WMMC500 TaxID=3015154 RepID=UPI00248AA566|nr:proton-conducting transporter membrane subunit [Streptomyces sp. WMMC500]WBB61704.1 proton-conducting transporter membrane subunit [Streptomyces sp. WMMC500]
MSAALWALVAVPLAAGALLAAAGRRADRYAPAVAVAASAAALVLAGYAAAARPATRVPLLAGLPFGLGAHGLSGLIAVTVAAVTLAVLVFGIAGTDEIADTGDAAHVAGDTADTAAGPPRARFFGLMLLFSGAMLVTVTATTLPALLMGWEFMGATSWALIGFRWRDPARADAAGVAYLTTRAADLGLYLAAGAALAAGPAAGLSLDQLHEVPAPWLHLLTAGVVAAALGKSAQLPFSFWLSRAMQGPSPVSALLHSATMVVAGAYLLLRLQPLLAASGWGDDTVAWTGAATALALGLVAVAQPDLKQLLAASSCAQIGFMVLAAGVTATTGGTLQLLAHAAAKSLAFLVAGFWLAALGAGTLPALRGAARRNRVAGAAFTVAALSLAGVPPLSLWAAKDLLLAGALEHSPALYAAGLAAAVVSAVYAARALWFAWCPPEAARLRATAAPPAETAAEGGEDAAVPRDRGPRSLPVPVRVPVPEALSFAVLALAVAALAVLALPGPRDAVAGRIGARGEAAPYAWEFTLSAALALAASCAVWARGERLTPAPAGLTAAASAWLGLEAAARAVVVRPVRRLAAALAAFDDRVLDRGVDGLARGTVRLARAVDRGAEAAVDGTVERVGAAARTLGRLARRPQTGQVHTYLAQAVAAFTVLAAVFVLVR